MHTRILAAPGQIDFSVIPESLDLCPGCNWDEAWLSRPWMWLNAPFILLLFWGVFLFFFLHFLSCCFGPLPHIVSLSSSPSFTWLPFCLRFIPQTSLLLVGCLDHTTTFAFSPQRTRVSHAPSSSLPLVWTFTIWVFWLEELQWGQVVETEGVDGKLADPRLNRRSLVKD